MSSFSEDEVNDLEEGGNRKARKVWLAGYEEPDTPISSSDTRRINEKIIDTYQKRLYHEDSVLKKEKKKTAKKKISRRSSEASEKSLPKQKSEASIKSKRTEKKNEEPLIDLLDFAMAVPQKAPEVESNFFDSVNSTSKAEEDFFVAPSVVNFHKQDGSNVKNPVDGLVEHLRQIMESYHLSPPKMEQICINAMNKVGIKISTTNTSDDLFAEAARQTVQPQSSQRYPPQQQGYIQQMYSVPMGYPQQGIPQYPSQQQVSGNPFESSGVTNGSYQQPAYDNPFADPAPSANPFAGPDPSTSHDAFSQIGPF